MPVYVMMFMPISLWVWERDAEPVCDMADGTLADIDMCATNTRQHLSTRPDRGDNFQKISNTSVLGVRKERKRKWVFFHFFSKEKTACDSCSKRKFTYNNKCMKECAKNIHVTVRGCGCCCHARARTHAHFAAESKQRT